MTARDPIIITIIYFLFFTLNVFKKLQIVIKSWLCAYSRALCSVKTENQLRGVYVGTPVRIINIIYCATDRTPVESVRCHRREGQSRYKRKDKFISAVSVDALWFSSRIGFFLWRLRVLSVRKRIFYNKKKISLRLSVLYRYPVAPLSKPILKVFRPSTDRIP